MLTLSAGLLLFVCYVLGFGDWVLLCIPVWPRTQSIEQAALRLTELCVPLLPKCWLKARATMPGHTSILAF